MTLLFQTNRNPLDVQEVGFNTSFPVINAIVYDVLDDHTLNRAVSDKHIPGLSHYRVWLEPSQALLSLKVLDRGPEITSLRLQAYPSPAGLKKAPEDDVWFWNLFVGIHMEVRRVLRLSDPKYSIEPTTLSDPPPHWNEGLQKVLAWRHFNARTLSDKELAKLVDVSYGTFRKALAKLNAQRSAPGRPRKG